MAKRILIGLLLAATGWAAEVVPIMDVNGTRYRDVRFGPINQDQIVIFHSAGVATVPVQSLPDPYRDRFALKPAPAAPVSPAIADPSRPIPPVSPPANSPPTNPAAILEAMRAQKQQSQPSYSGGRSDWTQYNQERAHWVVLDGMLVPKATLIPLIGFLAKERAQLNDGTRTYYGAALDLAERKNGAEKVAAAMELRPALWERTDERVFLLNYKPLSLPGALIKVYAVEVDPIDMWRTFKVGTEPSFEDWRRLPRK